MNRIISARSVLGEKLLFKRLQGVERLSTVFDFNVELLSPDASIEASELLGQPLCIEVQTADSPLTPPRYLHGEVIQFSYIGQESSGVRLARYELQMRPWLWYLGQNQDCKIYQNMTVVDILDEVLGSYPKFHYEKRLCAAYAPYEYCVQYEESDLNFIQRLMEKEGIYYYFEHHADRHVMVLCDDNSAHEDLSPSAQLAYYPQNENALPDAPCIYQWQRQSQLQTSSYVVDDYDFKKSATSLRQQRRVSYSIEQANREIYDWQVGYLDADQGDHYVRIRTEAAQAAAESIEGAATLRSLAPGYIFNLTSSPRRVDLDAYLLVAVEYDWQESGYASGDGAGHYNSRFLAQLAQIPYRSPLLASKPRTRGPQTAVVVGPAGSEVFTDEYQRIKVHFRWDRYGPLNENASCWIRVSNDSAGSGFGSIVPPRVGQEVVVDFIGGDPDRPVVIGRVYNDKQMPAFSPSPTQSGFVSRSFGGSADNANHLIFDDAAGGELVHLHAERNAKNTTEMDYFQGVGVNHRVEIGNDHQIQVGNNLSTVIKAIEERLVQAEQRIQVNSHALHRYDSNFEQRIKGVEHRVTEAEQNIQVNSDALHKYQGNLSQEVTGEDTKTVNANQVLTVLGSTLNKLYSLKRVVDTDSVEEVSGNKSSEVKGNLIERLANHFKNVKGTDFTHVSYSMGITHLSASATTLSASATGVSVSATGASASVTGYEFKAAKTKNKASAAEARLVGIERKLAASSARFYSVSVGFEGIRRDQHGMKQEMNGMKNSISALDNRVNGLTSVV